MTKGNLGQAPAMSSVDRMKYLPQRDMAVEPMPLSIGAPSEPVIAEREAIRDLGVAKTAGRRVLALLKGLAFQLQAGGSTSPTTRCWPIRSGWLGRL
jgi:hypothetical protein